MGSRSDLQTLLETLCNNVYFQPPPTTKMVYPCIRYELSNIDTRFADDKPYTHTRRYTLTLISKDPDEVIKDKIIDLPMCRYDRFYTADNLNHDVFELSY